MLTITEIITKIQEQCYNFILENRFDEQSKKTFKEFVKENQQLLFEDGFLNSTIDNYLTKFLGYGNPVCSEIFDIFAQVGKIREKSDKASDEPNDLVGSEIPAIVAHAVEVSEKPENTNEEPFQKELMIFHLEIETIGGNDDNYTGS